MVFLIPGFIQNWISQAGDSIMGAIEQGIRTLSFSLSTIIYKLVINLYNLFELLCNARLLDDNVLKSLSERIGYILGLIMFFNVCFSFIKMLIDPDSFEDKEKGAVAIIKKTLLVIVMLGSANFVFSTLYSVQRTVIKNHIISNILLPYKISDDSVDKFGAVLAEELMYSFYQEESFSNAEVDTDAEANIKSCQNMITAFRNQIINQYKFDLGYNCLNSTVEVNIQTNSSLGPQTQEVFIVNYNWAISPLAGVAVAYLLLMYCFKVGVRMVQLTFLEIISPMAIVSYLSPKKDTMFNKWGKIYVSTYIDVFIRIAIINFVIFLITTLFTSEGVEGLTLWESVGNPTDLYTKSFIMIVIILSLLTFAHKAPDLLKELLPASASKLGMGTSMKDIVGLQRASKIGTSILGGVAGGAAIGLLSGSPGGFVGGLLKGGLSGFKGQGIGKTATGAWKNQRDTIKKMRDIRANGGGWFGSHIAALQGNLGMRTAYERDETSIARAQQRVDMYNEASKEAESEAIKNGANYKMLSYDGMKRSLTELEMLRNDQTKTATDRAKYDKEYNTLLKSATMFNLDYGAAMEKSEANFTNSGDFDYVRTSSGSTYNTANIDHMSNADRERLIGSTNAKIEVNMSNLVGVSKSGRGSAGKADRNSNSTFITTTKGSDSYQRHKANAGK